MKKLLAFLAASTISHTALAQAPYIDWFTLRPPALISRGPGLFYDPLSGRYIQMHEGRPIVEPFWCGYPIPGEPMPDDAGAEAAEMQAAARPTETVFTFEDGHTLTIVPRGAQ